MALLAHEVGHHLNGHTIRKGGSTPELELEADEFAGFILHKLGATLQQSQNVMNYIAKEKESKTHPSKDSRLSAIEKGWNKASLQRNESYCETIIITGSPKYSPMFFQPVTDHFHF